MKSNDCAPAGEDAWQPLYRMMEDPDVRVRRAAWHTLEDGGCPTDPAHQRVEVLRELTPIIRGQRYHAHPSWGRNGAGSILWKSSMVFPKFSAWIWRI